MSDEDLEVLITLDDPLFGPDEDTFHDRTPQSQDSCLDEAGTVMR